MKKSVLLLGFLCSVFSLQISAADLCVNESGSGGCYTSISAAIAAASNGDRIFIEPKAGGVPYLENLTLNKSLQLLSNVEGQKWVLQGNIDVIPAVGRKISILHMKNLTGNIGTTTNSPAGSRCEVNIMNCELVDGDIEFTYNYYNVNVVSNLITGYVSLKYGNVIGNEITANGYDQTKYGAGRYSNLYLETDPVQTNDTLYIVGNKIYNLTANVCNTYFTGITVNTTSQFFNVSNNYWSMPNAGTSCSYPIVGICVNNAQNNAVGMNTIHNNTLRSVNTSYYYGIYFQTHPTNALTEVLNNLILNTNNTTNSLFVNSNNGNISFSYNFSTLPIYGLVNNGTNNLSTNTTVNVSNGQLNVGSDAINGGYPDPIFYDVDLTVNDVGAYGGSYTLDNFFPITGSSRVYFVKAPRTVLQSGTLNIRASSFDR